MIARLKVPTVFMPFFGLVVITLYFNTAFLDPFNLPKFLLLVLLGCIGVVALVKRLLIGGLRLPSTFLGFLVLLITFIHIFSAIRNEQSAWQTLIGTYQRNLGLLTYLCFGVIAVWISDLRDKKIGLKFVYLLVIVGSLEVFYGLIQWSGKDFISWNNPYSPIIGTFGNPNFMSAFLGFSAAAALLMLKVEKSLTLGLRTLLLTNVILALYLCWSSDSIQGLFVFITAITVASSIYLVKYKMLKIGVPFLTLTGLGGLFVVLGILQTGPLAKYLYQTSISARGDYWRAAFRATMENPLMGIGVDNFGEAYLKYRDLDQVQNRGFGTFTNNAHNLFLQYSSTLGIIGFSLLVILISYVLYMSFKIISSKGDKEVDIHIMVTALLASLIPVILISIDNIGFSIWFWALCGLITSEYAARWKEIRIRESAKPGYLGVSANVIAMLGVFFLLTQVAIADIRMRTIYQDEKSIIAPSSLLERYEELPSFSKDEVRYKTLVASFSYSKGWFKESIELADDAIAINKNYIDAWRIKALSQASLGNRAESILSREEIVKLDPLRLDNLLELLRGYLQSGMDDKARLILLSMERIAPKDQLTIAARQEFEDNSRN